MPASPCQSSQSAPFSYDAVASPCLDPAHNAGLTPRRALCPFAEFERLSQKNLVLFFNQVYKIWPVMCLWAQEYS